MKLLDRYVATSFLKNYFISFFVLVGIYIVLDMIFAFDELVEVNSTLSGLQAVIAFLAYIGDYYFYQMFLYFVHLSGIIPVVAGAFTLMRMVRFNELTAILSSGVPLVRVALPIVICALVLNGLLWVDQELIIPNLIPKLVRKHDYAIDSDWFPVSAMRAGGRMELTGGETVSGAAVNPNDPSGGHAKLFVSRYFPNANPPKMDVVTIIDQDDDFHPVSKLRADSAIWDESHRQWQLTNASFERNLSPASKQLLTSQKVTAYHSDLITPEEVRLYRSGDFVELLSTRRINDLLQRPLSYGRTNLLRVKHTRGVAQITINMIMLLLVISSVLMRDPQQLKSAAGRSIVLCGLCMTAAFLGQQMAGDPPPIPRLESIWPALMAWLPIFTFGPVSIFLLDRVQT